MSDPLSEMLREYLGADADDEALEKFQTEVITALQNSIAVPASPHAREGAVMELVIAAPMFDTHVSLKLRNLIPNALNPSGVRQFFAGGSAYAAATAGGPAAWAAFIIAMTVLIARPIPFAEACILHKAWKLARADNLITIDDLVAAGPEIYEEYGIAKYAHADIETYLNTLVRLGCLADHPNGYRLVERIALAQ